MVLRPSSLTVVPYCIWIRLSMHSFYLHNSFERQIVFLLISHGVEGVSELPKVPANSGRADPEPVSSDSRVQCVTHSFGWFGSSGMSGQASLSEGWGTHVRSEGAKV